MHLGALTVLLWAVSPSMRTREENALTRRIFCATAADVGKYWIFSGKKKKISLVILDLIMPVTGGRQCLDGILKIHPGARGFVGKPYDLDGTSQDRAARFGL
jgi:hypothetical protein